MTNILIFAGGYVLGLLSLSFGLAIGGMIALADAKEINDAPDHKEYQ